MNDLNANRFHVRPDDERDKHLLGPRSQYVHPPRIGGFILLRQPFMRALRGIVLDCREGRRRSLPSPIPSAGANLLDHAKELGYL